MRRTPFLALSAALLLLTGCAGGALPDVDTDPEPGAVTPGPESPEGFDEDFDELAGGCLTGVWALDLAAWAEEVRHIFTVQAQLEAEVTATGSALSEMAGGGYVMDVGVLTTHINVDLDGLPMEMRFVVTGVDTGVYELSGERLMLLSDGGTVETILLSTVGGIEIDEPAPVPIPLPWSGEMTVSCLEDTLEVGMSTGPTTVFTTYQRVD